MEGVASSAGGADAEAVLMFIFARFEPKTGMADELRAAIATVVAASRAEHGCVRINFYESTREPLCFYVHSQWVDEAAFEEHARFPHTIRFVAEASGLITNAVEAVRTREVG